MTPKRSSGLAWLAAATILVSAFLLFQVQPVISKKILPWFGGSPAVWTTCVLFFQLVLLAGYGYSHWLIKYVKPKNQGIIHVALLIVALCTLLIGPRDWWKPLDGTLPALRILVLLTAVVGASYFVLSTTGPLVQAWFSQLYPGSSPYRLYALSNVGSLAALLTYPFLIETALKVDNQWGAWALGFVLFAGLVGMMAFVMYREARAVPSLAVAQGYSPTAPDPEARAAAPEGVIAKPDSPKTIAERRAALEASADAPPTMWLRLGWLSLAALASMGFLAITNHLCQDIAVVPFMWVIPLSLYLLSFIICFDNERWYVRKFFGPATILGILWLTAMLHYSTVDEWMTWAQKPLTAQRQKWADAAAQAEANKEAAAKKEAEAKKEADTSRPPDEPTDAKPTSPPAEPPGVTAEKVEPLEFSYVMDKVFAGIGWVVKKLDGPFQSIFKPSFHLSFDVKCYNFDEHVVAISTSYMLVLFLICMACHGELVKSKPAPQHLTMFYLCISAGGAVGGLFVALICPLIYKLHTELAITMMGGFLVGCVALGNDGRNTWLKNREILQWIMAFVVVGGILLVAKGTIPERDSRAIAVERNFYGTIFVTQMGDEESEGRGLYNGRIWHGFQYLDPARQLEPTTYYVEGTGAAIAVMHHPRAAAGLKVGVIGLGTGSMAAHGKEGDKYYFYDIDPKVKKIAETHFTYLSKSPAKPEVILGDARICMERELAEDGSREYDVIVLDAFSSDAIPAHLLTDESFGLYEKHLRKDANNNPSGVIAIHISNRYIDLEPVVAAITRKYGYQTVSVHKTEDGGAHDTSSDWVLVTKNEEFLNNPIVKAAGEPLKPKKEVLWTDQFTALFQILK